MGTMRIPVTLLDGYFGEWNSSKGMKPRIVMSQSLARVTSSLKSTYSSPQSTIEICSQEHIT